MNPEAQTPNMKPAGAKSPLVYVLGEAPTDTDDRSGKPFKNRGGRLMREAWSGWIRTKVRYDYIVRTKIPESRKDAHPTPTEMSCFREEVIASIEAAKPNVVVACGDFVTRWALNMKKASWVGIRGRKFPMKFGSHVCWVFPIMSPDDVVKFTDSRYRKIPGSEWERFFRRDLMEIEDTAEENDKPTWMSVEEAREGIEIVDTIEGLQAAFDYLVKEDRVTGYDFEATALRPYKRKGEREQRVLSVALSVGERTFSIPIDHPSAPWSKSERKTVKKMFRAYCATHPRLLAHNAPFDAEWHVCWLGVDALWDVRWECSLQASYVLNGVGGNSLHMLCLEHFGLPLKDLTNADAYFGRLDEMNLEPLLDYNGLDAKWCLELGLVLLDLVEERDLMESYKRQMGRTIPAVLAQYNGVPIVQEITEKLSWKVEAESQAAYTEIMNSKPARRFRREYGRSLKVSSPKDLGMLFHDMLGVPEVDLGDGKISTKAEVLEKIESRYPIARHILTLRSGEKLSGTYVEKMKEDHPETYVYADGKTHCQFKISSTATTRLSSSQPNNQNWPNRKAKWIREQMTAPEGWTYVCVDYGQIEASGLAIASRDPVWVQMIWDDYDVHMEWAEKIVAGDESVLERHKGNMKSVRSATKNELVFPAFYGAAQKSIAGFIGIDEEFAEELFSEFWDTFAGIKTYQQEQWRLYQKVGFVRSLTGRERYGPLSWNQVCNSPIQTLASDIVCWAWEQLCVQGREMDMPWLAPVLQIHDDLTLLVPISRVEDAIEEAVTTMLSFDAPWMNVPLKVEVTVGENMAEQEEILVMRSDEL